MAEQKRTLSGPSARRSSLSRARIAACAVAAGVLAALTIVPATTAADFADSTIVSMEQDRKDRGRDRSGPNRRQENAPPARSRDDGARQRAQDQARQRAADQARQRAQDDARRRAEDQAKQRAQDQARQRAQDDAQRRAEDDARQRAQDQARQRAQDDARRRAEDQARQRVQDQARQRAQDDAQRRAEDQARQRVQDQARQRAQDDAQRRAEDQARQRVQDQARQRAQDDARRRAEDQARQRVQDQARQRAQDTGQRAADQARQRAQQDATSMRDNAPTRGLGDSNQRDGAKDTAPRKRPRIVIPTRGDRNTDTTRPPANGNDRPMIGGERTDDRDGSRRPSGDGRASDDRNRTPARDQQAPERPRIIIAPGGTLGDSGQTQPSPRQDRPGGESRPERGGDVVIERPTLGGDRTAARPPTTRNGDDSVARRLRELEEKRRAEGRPQIVLGDDGRGRQDNPGLRDLQRDWVRPGNPIQTHDGDERTSRPRSDDRPGVENLPALGGDLLNTSRDRTGQNADDGRSQRTDDGLPLNRSRGNERSLIFDDGGAPAGRAGSSNDASRPRNEGFQQVQRQLDRRDDRPQSRHPVYPHDDQLFAHNRRFNFDDGNRFDHHVDRYHHEKYWFGHGGHDRHRSGFSFSFGYRSYAWSDCDWFYSGIGSWSFGYASHGRRSHFSIGFNTGGFYHYRPYYCRPYTWHGPVRHAYVYHRPWYWWYDSYCDWYYGGWYRPYVSVTRVIYRPSYFDVGYVSYDNSYASSSVDYAQREPFADDILDAGYFGENVAATVDDAWNLLSDGYLLEAREQFAELKELYPFDAEPAIGYAISAGLLGGAEATVNTLRDAIVEDPGALVAVPMNPSLERQVARLLDRHETYMSDAAEITSDDLFIVATMRYLLDQEAIAFFTINEAIDAGDTDPSTLALRDVIREKMYANLYGE